VDLVDRQDRLEDGHETGTINTATNWGQSTEISSSYHLVTFGYVDTAYLGSGIRASNKIHIIAIHPASNVREVVPASTQERWILAR
jgi:hypothetical protein